MDKKNVLSCKCTCVVKCITYCMYDHVKEHINHCNIQLLTQPSQLSYRTCSVVLWLICPLAHGTVVCKERYIALIVRCRCFEAAAQPREGFTQL